MFAAGEELGAEATGPGGTGEGVEIDIEPAERAAALAPVGKGIVDLAVITVVGEVDELPVLVLEQIAEVRRVGQDLPAGARRLRQRSSQRGRPASVPARPRPFMRKRRVS